jgi:hypothetical protein
MDCAEYQEEVFFGPSQWWDHRFEKKIEKCSDLIPLATII